MVLFISEKGTSPKTIRYFATRINSLKYRYYPLEIILFLMINLLLIFAKSRG